MGLEWRNGVAKRSGEMELQNRVTKKSHKMKKYGGVCNRLPEGSTKVIKNNVQNEYVV